ncbi:NACHT domain-containing protein [Amycolatopsis pigmentata]|uniref:NACHT domain-containing protein n=1 Tax=Amycolatopsis pigmentata TaxID=450801 RepID=A0ABW5FZ55_9PSEU
MTSNEINGPVQAPAVMAGKIDGSVTINYRPARSDALAEAADQLAQAVGTRWRREEEQRQVQDPFPLPARWQPAAAEVTDHWENICRGSAEEPHGPLDLAGQLDQIVDVYRRIPSGRLVILGRAGSGKTILTIRFVLDLLKARTGADAVPVIFSLGSWNPTARTLRDWLIGQLIRDHPGLATTGPDGSTLAAALVETDRILPVLDGFDEIAGGLHPAALRELNRTTSLPLLLTSRRVEYEAAVEGTDVLSAAAGIELADLVLADLVDYLPLTTRKVTVDGTATVWEPVLNELRDHPRRPASVNLATALTTPLMVALARTIFSDTPDHDPAELLDTDRFDSPEALKDHLVGNFIPTVYQDLPGQRWDLDRVRRWLCYLAQHLDRLGTPNLAWWQLGNTMRRSSRILTVANASGWLLGIVDGVLTGVVDWVRFEFAAGLKVGLLAGIAVGIVGGLVFGLMHEFAPRFLLRSATLEPSRVQVRFRREPGKMRARFAPRFLVGFGAGLVFGIVVWLVIGFVVWFAIEFMSWLVRGPASTLVSGLFPGAGPGANGLARALEDALGYGLGYGLVYALMIGLAAGIMTRLEVPIDIRSAVSPTDLLRANRTTTVVQFLVWGLVGVLVGGLSGVLWFPLEDGLLIGLVGGIGGGIAYGLGLTAWGQWVVMARIWLPLTGRLPWTMTAFLDDAYQRGVLRQAGAVYQFRHARLQDHLIDTVPIRE